MKQKQRSNTPNKASASQPAAKKTEYQLESYRFAHFQPQAVETMAITEDRKLVAVARSNNSIEIWKRDSWSQIQVLPGNANCPIRNLHWYESKGTSKDKNPLYHGDKKRRLIATSLNGQVIEWDLLTGQIRYKFAAQAAIWNSQLVGKFLYCACEDGSIKVVKVKKHGLESTRTYQKTEARCLSLALDDKQMFAGYSDGSIRKWELASGSCTLHI